MATTVERVRDILTGFFGDTVGPILPRHHLKDDLGCDSLDIVEIGMHLDDEFGLVGFDEVLQIDCTVQTVGDQVDMMTAKRVA